MSKLSISITNISHFYNTINNNLSKAPLHLHYFMFAITIEFDIQENYHKMINKQQFIEIVERKRDYHYQVMPMFNGSTENDLSINKITSILHDRCRLTMLGKPTAVRRSLHDMDWGKRVCLKTCTSWEGMSLGLFNNKNVNVLWARDAPKAFELTHINNLAFSLEDELPRIRNKVSYKSFF